VWASFKAQKAQEITLKFAQAIQQAQVGLEPAVIFGDGKRIALRLEEKLECQVEVQFGDS
jgi:hypothetical protein